MLNIGKIIGKFVKNSSQRELGQLEKIVKKINDWEPALKKMTDVSFPAKTEEFRTKIKNGTKLEDLIPD